MGAAWSGKDWQARSGKAGSGPARIGTAGVVGTGCAGSGRAWMGLDRQAWRVRSWLAAASTGRAWMGTAGNKEEKSMSAIRDEILQIEAMLKKAGVTLQAEAVVEAARDEASYPNLHASFEWDDAKAAHQHRIAQAHQLIIRCRITLEDGRTMGLSMTKPMRQFVNLRDDVPGYRNMLDVVNDEVMLKRLYDQMESDLVRLTQRIQAIETLRPMTAQPAQRNVNSLSRWLASARQTTEAVAEAG